MAGCRLGGQAALCQPIGFQVDGSRFRDLYTRAGQHSLIVVQAHDKALSVGLFVIIVEFWR